MAQMPPVPKGPNNPQSAGLAEESKGSIKPSHQSQPAVVLPEVFIPSALGAKVLPAAHLAPPVAQMIVAEAAAVVANSARTPLENFYRLLGLIRDVRAEAQNLQRSLNEVRKKSELVDNNVREAEIGAAMGEQTRIFEYNTNQIAIKFLQARASLEADGHLYSQMGDEVSHIENFWERATASWPTVAQPSSAILAGLDRVDAHLHQLILRCALITIPERVTEHLNQLRAGRSLDFHSTFKDEVESEADRIELLNYLYDHPLAVPGVVDVEHGKIYRTSPKAWRRSISYLIPLLLPAIGALILPYAYKSVDENATDAFLYSLVKGYLVLIAGGYAHVLVGAFKEARGTGRKAFFALEDWLIWLHVKEVQIVVGIMSLWIGFIGILVVNKSVPIVTAFFVGYSIDSFADLFLERFSATVATKNVAVKKVVAG